MAKRDYAVIVLEVRDARKRVAAEAYVEQDAEHALKGLGYKNIDVLPGRFTKELKVLYRGGPKAMQTAKDIAQDDSGELFVYVVVGTVRKQLAGEIRIYDTFNSRQQVLLKSGPVKTFTDARSLGQKIAKEVDIFIQRNQVDHPELERI